MNFYARYFRVLDPEFFFRAVSRAMSVSFVPFAFVQPRATVWLKYAVFHVEAGAADSSYIFGSVSVGLPPFIRRGKL